MKLVEEEKGSVSPYCFLGAAPPGHGLIADWSHAGLAWSRVGLRKSWPGDEWVPGIGLLMA